MALTDYTPAVDFSLEEASATAGRSTVRTAAIDSELDNIATAINAGNDAIQDVRRSDGKLKDNVVEPHTLSSQTLAALATAFSPQGDWVTATEYAVRDVVEYQGGGYLCVTAHASGTFATDLAAGYWLKMWDESFECLDAAPVDADIPRNRAIMYLDEGSNEAYFRIRYSDDTMKTATLSLT